MSKEQHDKIINSILWILWFMGVVSLAWFLLDAILTF